MVYKWRTMDYSVPAQDVGEHIEELEREHGEITRQLLVDDARPEAALMHPLYEWRDNVAAEKYRLSQAGKIMSELVVVRVAQQEEKEQPVVRAFVSKTPVNTTASYISTIKALSDASTKEVVLENARRELRMMERKYRDLIDFAALLDEFREEIA